VEPCALLCTLWIPRAFFKLRSLWPLSTCNDNYCSQSIARLWESEESSSTADSQTVMVYGLEWLKYFAKDRMLRICYTFKHNQNLQVSFRLIDCYKICDCNDTVSKHAIVQACNNTLEWVELSTRYSNKGCWMWKKGEGTTNYVPSNRRTWGGCEHCWSHNCVLDIVDTFSIICQQKPLFQWDRGIWSVERIPQSDHCNLANYHTKPKGTQVVELLAFEKWKTLENMHKA
jgi:hypothetical protein